MHKLSKFLMPMLVLATLLISACAGAAAPASGGSKVEAAPVEFTGVIELMDGNQWTLVGGQVITVDPSLVRDGPFNIGDTVKVEVAVRSDGSVVVTRVESPSPEDSDTSETPDASSTPDPATGSVTPISTNGGLVFDTNGTEAFGTVDSITVDTVVIGGQSFSIANAAEFKDQIQAGDFVKVHFSLNADGTMSITEIEISNPALINGNDSKSDDSLDDNSDDDDDSADDNGNDSNDNENEDDSNSGGDDNSGSGGGHD